MILTLHSASAVGLYNRIPEPLHWPYFYLHATAYLHFVSLIWARARPLWFRALISIPGLAFSSGVLLGVPWALVGAFGVALPGVALPFVLAAFGLLQSLWTQEEERDLIIERSSVPKLQRHRPKTAPPEQRPLKIVQITDPHIGPFMSVARLRKICERAAARQPDLILLTGDFLTMESQSDPELLSSALQPLKAMRGRTFACLGNHDLEAPRTVQQALASADIQLLVDEQARVQTEAGPIQIIGANFVWRDREAHLAELDAAHPKLEDHRRLLLLHDPGAFAQMPPGGADLVLSGHTHGGQLGLLSLGLSSTAVSAFSSIPDHGLWARGQDRLYVHRGTGHYGFPLRIGVPAEQSLLNVYFSSD